MCLQLGEELHRDLERVSFVLPDSDSEGEADSFTAQMTGTQLFELYLCLNEFAGLKHHLPPRYLFFFSTNLGLGIWM